MPLRRPSAPGASAWQSTFFFYQTPPIRNCPEIKVSYFIAKVSVTSTYLASNAYKFIDYAILSWHDPGVFHQPMLMLLLVLTLTTDFK